MAHYSRRQFIKTGLAAGCARKRRKPAAASGSPDSYGLGNAGKIRTSR
jgi:hypothetical protein